MVGVDALAVEQHLTGQVDVMSSGGGAFVNKGVTVLGVRADRGGDDPGSLRERLQRRGVVGVGDDQGEIGGGGTQIGASGCQLLEGTATEADLRTFGSMFDEVVGE